MWKIEFWLRAATDVREMSGEFPSSVADRVIKIVVQ
jgi:hypothetical protein